MIKKLFKSHKVQAAVFAPLYLLSKKIKRDPLTWAFAPLNHAFLDNGKYFFLYVLKNFPQVNAAIVTLNRDLYSQLKKMGLPVYYRWSLKGVWFSLKARYYFISAYVDDVNYWTSGGAVVFNLWHGIPLKKIEFDIDRGPLVKRFKNPGLKLRLFKPWFYRRPDYVLSTSETVSALFASAFRVPEERCVPFGYPRTDIFFQEQERIRAHIKQYEPREMEELLESFARFERVVLYMPTWRDDKSDFVARAFPDLDRLNAVLKKKNTLLLVKLHPNDARLQLFENFSHIRSVPAKVDLYPLLPFTHGLITDYSSIYFDYMLLNKPIVFYAFDLENYTKLRGFYFDYSEVTPGPVVKDFDALINLLQNVASWKIDDTYRQLRKKFWKYADGNSSQRLAEFVLKLESQ